MRISDWSSDVCSSDLSAPPALVQSPADGIGTGQRDAAIVRAVVIPAKRQDRHLAGIGQRAECVAIEYGMGQFGEALHLAAPCVRHDGRDLARIQRRIAARGVGTRHAAHSFGMIQPLPPPPARPPKQPPAAYPLFPYSGGCSARADRQTAVL